MEQETKDEVTITHETLRDLLRNERTRGDLQKLDDSFFANVLRYLKDKQAIINKQQTDLFSAEEKIKTEGQLEKVKNFIKELYNKREKKIINMAIDKSKDKSSIVDNSVFLEQEKRLFDNAVKLLSMGRENVLFNIMELKEPTALGMDFGKKETASPDLGSASPEEEKKDTKLVRFLNAVPKFVGKELEEYGPFEEEDIASLPVEIANVLINKERVEEISED